MLYGSLTYPALHAPLFIAATVSTANRPLARELRDRIFILKLRSYLGLKSCKEKNKVPITFYPPFVSYELRQLFRQSSSLVVQLSHN